MATSLTRKEAAALCGCHEDTIRRDERDGKYPNRRQRHDGTWEIPVADLVNAARLDPMLARGDVEDAAARSRAERDLIATRQDLAVAKALIEQLTARLADARADVAFLREQLAKAGR